MLTIIEYSLLAVSLLVVIGLIVSGTRSGPDSTDTGGSMLTDSSEAHESGKLI